MTNINKNTLANYVGTAWSIIMGLAFIPLYLQYLGTEAYGMISFFGLLQISLIILDFGFTQTVKRITAQSSANIYNTTQLHQLLHSIETIYLILAGVGLLLISINANWLTSKWIGNHQLDPKDVRLVLIISSFVIAFRFLCNLYKSGINGLQAQIPLNIIHIIFSALRGFGVVAVLAWLSATLQAFFMYQAIIAALEAFILRHTLYRLLPARPISVTFSRRLLFQIWNFAAGVTFSAILLTGIFHADRILLSSMVSLTEFAYYSLAMIATSALFLFATPINEALQPRLTELAAHAEYQQLGLTYRRYSRWLVVAITPAAMTLATFPEHALYLWGQDNAIIARVASLVAILAVGMLLYNVNYLTRILSLAYGNTRLLNIVYGITALLLIPALNISIHYAGVIGAAWCWLGMNVLHFLSIPWLVHQRFNPEISRMWYTHDILPVFVATLLTCLLLAKCLPAQPSSVVISLGVLSVTAIGTYLTAAWVMPDSRQWLQQRWRHMRPVPST